MAGTMAVAFGFGISLFRHAALRHQLPSGLDHQRHNIIFNLVDGVIRVAVFLLTLDHFRMSDIQRVFQYHGAEHNPSSAFRRERNGPSTTYANQLPPPLRHQLP